MVAREHRRLPAEQLRTARDLERLLEGARPALLETVRIFDLGRLPLIQGVIAQASL